MRFKWLVFALVVLMLPGVLLGGCKGGSKEGLTFYEFYDPTWPRCQNMEPIVDAVMDKYKGKLDFELLDITKPENDKIASKYRVYLTPTFVIIDSKGKEVDRLIGEVPRKTLETFINKNLAKQKGGEEE